MPRQPTQAEVEWISEAPRRIKDVEQQCHVGTNTVMHWRDALGLPIGKPRGGQPVEAGDMERDDATDDTLHEPEPLIETEDEWHLLEEAIHKHAGDLWAALESVQESTDALSNRRKETHIKLNEKQPVLLVYLSDLHVGHIRSSLRKIREDIELISQTPGVYVMLGGDLFDNVLGFHHTGMNFEELIGAEWQELLVDHLAQRLEGRLIGSVLGNHDEYSVKLADHNPIVKLAKKLNAPYFGAWGVINLTLGEQTYRIGLGHQYRKNSSDNRTHAPKKWNADVRDVDAAFLGHKHSPAAEDTDVRGSERLFFQAGAYLRGSRFGDRLGFNETFPQMPSAVLFGDQWYMEPTKDTFRDGLYTGIHKLASYRNDVECPCRYCERKRAA